MLGAAQGLVKYDKDYKAGLQKREKEQEAAKAKLEKELERLKKSGSGEAELERKAAEIAMWGEIDAEMMKVVPAINEFKSTLERQVILRAQK